MRFLGSKFSQYALAPGAPPRTPLKRSPDPLPILGGRFAAGERERSGKGRKERAKEVLGRERGREGKWGEMERERRREREGRGSLRLWR